MAAVVCEGIMVQRPLEPTLSALQMPRGTLIACGTRNQCMRGSTERGRREKAARLIRHVGRRAVTEIRQVQDDWLQWEATLAQHSQEN